MLEKWKKAVDTKKDFSALLTDLSKALDCLPHDLIIAKLNAYRFSLPALNLIQNYIVSRKQITKINDSCSPWSDILFGVPQGSILGPSLFNIFLVISLLLLKMLISQVILMITHFMTHVILQKKSCNHYKVYSTTFFNGYQIIRWKVTLKSVIL